jgi:hypothetical protein
MDKRQTDLRGEVHCSTHAFISSVGIHYRRGRRIKNVWLQLSFLFCPLPLDAFYRVSTLTPTCTRALCFFFSFSFRPSMSVAAHTLLRERTF